jgi:ATP-dependent DNA helicase RecQ
MPDLQGNQSGDGQRTPLAVLREVFGFDSFRGQQLAIIEHVIAGGDAVVLMPTGGGKSLCYQVPALLRPGIGVVVSPLIALMKDQVDALCQTGVRAAALNSRLSPADAMEIERAVRDTALDLLYVSPERLLTPRCLELLSRGRLALFAVDEAHCISQ